MKKADILEVLKKEYVNSMWLALHTCEKGSEDYKVQMAESTTLMHVINMLTDNNYANEIKRILDAETD